eukprot:8687743-Pyramimonas_sp.AAC.1
MMSIPRIASPARLPSMEWSMASMAPAAGNPVWPGTPDSPADTTVGMLTASNSIGNLVTRGLSARMLRISLRVPCEFNRRRRSVTWHRRAPVALPAAPADFQKYARSLTRPFCLAHAQSAALTRSRAGGSENWRQRGRGAIRAERSQGRMGRACAEASEAAGVVCEGRHIARLSERACCVRGGEITGEANVRTRDGVRRARARV